MKKNIFIPILIGLFLLSYSLAAAATYSVSVTVKDVATNSPVSDAQVLVTNASSNNMAAAGHTDISGNATIGVPNVGDYTIGVVKAKYMTQSPPFLVVLNDVSPSSAVTVYLQYTIDLVQGWNLISFPKLPSNKDIGVILQDILSDVKIVWGYDNQHKNWLKYKPASTGNTLTQFEGGKGYWLYLDKQASLGLTGEDVSSNIHLYDNWNLVGYNAQDYAFTGTALSPLGNSWSIIWHWVPGDPPVWYAGHSTIAKLPDPIGVLGHLDTGKAYWINMKKGQGKDWMQASYTSHTVNDASSYTYANWMTYNKANNYNQVSTMKLTDLVLLGSHDAATADISVNSQPCYGEIFQEKQSYYTSPTLSDVSMSVAQSASIFEQLQNGVRYLDLRVALQNDCSGNLQCSKSVSDCSGSIQCTGTPQYYAQHMWLSTPILGTNGVFDQVKQFFKENPYEIVIMVFAEASSHLYISNPPMPAGFMSQTEAHAFINCASQNLPLVPVPSDASPMLTTLGNIWNSTRSLEASPGYVILIGDNSWESPYVWDFNQGVDSVWQQYAGNVPELITDLSGKVLAPWVSGPSDNKLHVIQAMTNDNNKVVNACIYTNPAITWQLSPPPLLQPPPVLPSGQSYPQPYASWNTYPINVVQVNDSVGASQKLLPNLFQMMKLKAPSPPPQ
jgi:hypothetical protein